MLPAIENGFTFIAFLMFLAGGQIICFRDGTAEENYS